jgi:hypothetical protein
MIDINNIILMNFISKLDMKNGITYEMIGILILFFINIYKDKINFNFNFNFNKYTSIELIGWEFLRSSTYIYEYNHNMTAVNYYICLLKKRGKNYNYFNESRNGVYYSEDIKKSLKYDNSPSYIINNLTNLHIEDDIYIDIGSEKINMETENNKQSFNWKITMKIKSYKYDLTYIQNFIDKCIMLYEKYKSIKNKNKTYHFIYQGYDNEKLNFSESIISDFNNEDYQNYETFNNIFHSNKNQIINDLNKLKDLNYYKRTGFKRKKGYMFYGNPGTGKTSTVMAMSNYDKRHIIEVPLSRIKTNIEIENILKLNKINNVNFNSDNIIILFDEIDINTELNRDEYNKSDIQIKSDNQIKSSNPIMLSEITCKVKKEDKLNIGTLLSRFDGIGNYGGLIIIATTNNISNIDPALYRDGRLNLIEFKNASKEDIKNIIENYYNILITEGQLKKIENIEYKYPHSTLISKLEIYNDIDEYLDYFINN